MFFFGRRILAAIAELRVDLKRMGDRMDKSLSDILDAIDAETNLVAAEVAKIQSDLKAALGAAGVQQAVDPALLARLTAVSDRLKSIAADPADPVPVAPIITPPPAV